ncbi:potassium transporter TrkA [Haloprofundus marisrubri]|uniref:Potassium transporter TrkA n=1 Tax=Haloprofundus marisrubri TaxID=1514971 RepID=A0A0W1R4B1_9EURY|nr:TrkA C-terminal domain-containing protein [Haloprofundus marisrubri]KTG07935.1 potassium transporter TrkA [Haloprofundus marisrubri]
MTVYESDLPGVGKKFEVELNDGSQLVIVIHNTGKRELYLRESPDADSDKLFELSDRLSRQVGTIMEGAYFQPIRTETIDTVLSDDTLIEWVKLSAESPLVGKTLAESHVRQRVGVSVIAVQRGDETISNPEADLTLQEGDTLVVIGGQDACREFQEYATAESSSNE